MSANTNEHDAIKACIQKYIDGIAKHDTDLIAEAFHPQALMSSHRGDEFVLEQPAGQAIVDYMNEIPPVYETSPDFKGRILMVEQNGTMATAIIAEDDLEGFNFATYFHLHKVEGTWLIISKATYGEPVGN